MKQNTNTANINPQNKYQQKYQDYRNTNMNANKTSTVIYKETEIPTQV